MKTRNDSSLTVIYSTLALFGVGLSRPTPAFADEIKVSLFGQPCTMNGSFPKATLTLIHEISPEKIPPESSVDLMKKIRSKTILVKSVPFPIEQYRDHLRKRLSAKIAFEEALIASKKSKGKDPKREIGSFLKNLKEHIPTLQYPTFETTTQKAFEENNFTWSTPFIESLRERYDGSIQPETEEEFHKAIRTVKIQYVCVFDDGSDHSKDDAPEKASE